MTFLGSQTVFIFMIMLLPGLPGDQLRQPQERGGEADLPAGAGEIQPPGYTGSHQQGESPHLHKEGRGEADLPAGAGEIQPPGYSGSHQQAESLHLHKVGRGEADILAGAGEMQPPGY